MTAPDAADLLELINHRAGHFLLESGHHGELWLDLDTVLLRPGRLMPFIEGLAQRLAETVNPEGICGPLLGGGLIASAVATILDCELYVSEPTAPSGALADLFRARYQVPRGVRSHLVGRRVAVVDDVINAGSATRAAVADLRAGGATVVAIGALLVLGERAAEYARAENLRLVHVAAKPARIWAPDDCPLCAAGEVLEDLAATGAATASPMSQARALEVVSDDTRGGQ